jgi:osmoprotectant transport system substrate-binding protein
MRAVAVALACLAAACGGGERLVVGSKNFTEQRLLGELVAQTAEAAGVPVERRLDLGGTFVCDSALRAGQLDVYVEYTGTALTAILKQPPDGDPARVLARVRDAYAPAGLAWTAPLGFDNTFALVVRADVSAHTIDDAVPYAKDWRAGFGYEFQQRPDGLPAVARVYGLSFRDVKTMDLGLLYRALTDRQVDVVAGNATDGLIDTLGLHALADDRHAFPPYEAVPVIRRAALERWSALGPALDGLGGALDGDTMRRLNAAVDAGHRDVAAVVREWRTTRRTAAAATSQIP